MKKAIKLSPDLSHTHFYLALVYSSLDREEEAQSSAKKALESDSYWSVSLVYKKWRYKTKNNLPKFIDALRKAGFPE